MDKTYADQFRNGLLDRGVDAALADRVIAKVSFGEGCWECRNAGHRGYSSLWYGGKNWPAHRLVFLLWNGPLNVGVCALHKCDNRRCIRPDHLFSGTKRDNALDCVSKGRHAMQVHPESSSFVGSTHNRGSRHPLSKLSEADVLAIRGAVGTHTEVAKQFGIKYCTVSLIRRRLRWGHLPEAA